MTRPTVSHLLAATLLQWLVLAGCAPAEQPPDRQDAAPSRAPGSTPLLRLLERVEIREVAWRKGYTRAGFGEEWTDDYRGPFGRNGCDTRQDVLLEQLSDIELRWGSRCRIYDATLVDPYTGRQLTWRHDGYWIEIDHIYQLARAWDAGAWSWPAERRVRFANDVRRELLAVSHQGNQAKGASTLADWLPPNSAYHCTYATKYLTVAVAWRLPVTPGDAAAVRLLAPDCG